MTTKKYSLTDEHRAQLKPWADLWIDRIMSCAPMDTHDKEQMITAINGLYESANLPRPKHIVFVPSPLVARVASGFAAAIWWLHDNYCKTATDAAATRDATDAATSAATYAATRAATYDATSDATYAATVAAATDATRDATSAATDAATRVAIRAATRAAISAATVATRDATVDATFDAISAATRDATVDATSVATDAATYAATDAATRDATSAATVGATLSKGWAWEIANKLNARNARFLIDCVDLSYRMNNGGNHWGQWVAFLSFFRVIAKLDLPIYDKWIHYENAAIHGSWRYMHPKFCIVSDRPQFIKIDDQRRPHCENGPSHKWRDGWSVYHWHGIRIPAEWIEDKSLTPSIALGQENAELRRAACEILGWNKILADPSLNPVIIDEDLPHIGTLVQIDLPDAPKQWFLKFKCGTGREFAEPVNDKSFDTALKANAGGNGWRPGMGDPESFIPLIRT